MNVLRDTLTAVPVQLVMPTYVVGLRLGLLHPCHLSVAKNSTASWHLNLDLSQVHISCFISTCKGCIQARTVIQARQGMMPTWDCLNEFAVLT